MRMNMKQDIPLKQDWEYDWESVLTKLGGTLGEISLKLIYKQGWSDGEESANEEARLNRHED